MKASEQIPNDDECQIMVYAMPPHGSYLNVLLYTEVMIRWRHSDQTDGPTPHHPSTRS